MLSESARFATIEKLKALAEHPATAPVEAENALRRIEEIEERIESERTQVRNATSPTARSRTSGANGI